MQFQLIEKQIGSIENLENQNFRENNLIFENTPQSIEYKKKMHEYEMKCFSKTQVLNPVFPKLRFSHILPLKSQTQNMFCTKTQNNCKLGWSD